MNECHLREAGSGGRGPCVLGKAEVSGLVADGYDILVLLNCHRYIHQRGIEFPLHLGRAEGNAFAINDGKHTKSINKSEDGAFCIYLDIEAIEIQVYYYSHCVSR